MEGLADNGEGDLVAQTLRTETNGPKGCRNQKNSQDEPEITDAVDDECFLARISRRLLQKIKANQEIAAKADALPSNKKQKQIVGEHQRQHRKHEQVQIPEEPVVAAFVRHVPD